MRVEIYSKPDCCLCDDAKAVIERVRQKIPFDLIEIDVEKDAGLFERYRYDIPVVFVEGHKAFKHRVDPDLFEKRVRRELESQARSSP